MDELLIRGVRGVMGADGWFLVTCSAVPRNLEQRWSWVVQGVFVLRLISWLGNVVV